MVCNDPWAACRALPEIETLGRLRCHVDASERSVRR